MRKRNWSNQVRLMSFNRLAMQLDLRKTDCTSSQQERSRDYSLSVPLVLGTPVMRGSASTAMRNARAVALKIPSAM